MRFAFTALQLYAAGVALGMDTALIMDSYGLQLMQDTDVMPSCTAGRHLNRRDCCSAGKASQTPLPKEFCCFRWDCLANSIMRISGHACICLRPSFFAVIFVNEKLPGAVHLIFVDIISVDAWLIYNVPCSLLEHI